jgi:hypothetical protein
MLYQLSVCYPLYGCGECPYALDKVVLREKLLHQRTPEILLNVACGW